MLEGTSRAADEIVATVPPQLVPVSVEKVAINAVMAGCKPEYLPVVLAAVEAACTDTFNIHGLLCTTYFSGPLLIVNGPLAARIGMNSGHNVLGQGNRANSTIGRALQLVIRNVGGGQPGKTGIDRSAFGAPSKAGWAIAENEADLPPGWVPMSVEAGFETGEHGVVVRRARPLRSGRSAVSLSRFADRGVRAEGGVELRSQVLRPAHRQHVAGDGPEHGRVFAADGWDKARVREELNRRIFAVNRA